MKILIIIIIAFLVVLYVFTFIKWKKRKKKSGSAIEDFKETYIDKASLTATKKLLAKEADNITKYNSNLDYIDHDEWVKEIQEDQEEKQQKKKFKYLHKDLNQ